MGEEEGVAWTGPVRREMGLVWKGQEWVLEAVWVLEGWKDSGEGKSWRLSQLDGAMPTQESLSALEESKERKLSLSPLAGGGAAETGVEEGVPEEGDEESVELEVVPGEVGVGSEVGLSAGGVVERVETGSRWESSPLRLGDVVVSLEGRALGGSGKWPGAWASAAAQDKVKMSVRRSQSRRQTLQKGLVGEKLGAVLEVGGASDVLMRRLEGGQELGLRLETLEGRVVVVDVSAAGKALCQQWDVIRAINDAPVNDALAAQRIVKGTRPGRPLVLVLERSRDASVAAAFKRALILRLRNKAALRKSQKKREERPGAGGGAGSAKTPPPYPLPAVPDDVAAISVAAQTSWSTDRLKTPSASIYSRPACGRRLSHSSLPTEVPIPRDTPQGVTLKSLQPKARPAKEPKPDSAPQDPADRPKSKASPNPST